MKRCFKCHEEKPLTDFYRHRSMKDGRLGKCKECTKADVRRHRQTSDRPREYDIERYQKDPERRAHIARNARRWRKNNPAGYRAHCALNNAVRDGKIMKGPCEICGTTENVHAHHDDYDAPLDVQWLCPKHHAAKIAIPF